MFKPLNLRKIKIKTNFRNYISLFRMSKPKSLSTLSIGKSKEKQALSYIKFVEHL